MPAPLQFIPAMKGYSLALMPKHVPGRTNQAVWMLCEHKPNLVSYLYLAPTGIDLL